MGISLNSPCMAAGRMRYVHVRRFSERGAVNALPEICSAYKPCATCCGEFCPCGKDP